MWGMLGFGGAKMPQNGAAWPPKDLGDKANAAKLADEQHKELDALQNDKDWKLVSWNDPERADMKLWSRPQIGNYHFVKATFTVDGTPQQFVDLVGSNDLAVRNKFSADCVGMKEIEQVTPESSLVHVKYWAPPPVAGRDFSFLITKKAKSADAIDLFGCSVADSRIPEEGYTQVRGASFWGWRLLGAGDKTLVSYTNCFDPRGWTPGFLLAWMKTTVSKELCAIRNVLAGKEADLAKVELADVGVSQDEIDAETKKHEAEQKK